MLVDWPLSWITVLNILGWPAIQLGLARLFTSLPEHWFHPPTPRPWEHEGKLYDRWLAVRQWKHRLPDGAAWFKSGFAKRHLYSRDVRYLQRFVKETWRGELCHWCALAFTPVFAVWNPPWAFVIMALCGSLLNLPCIVALRFNRARLFTLLHARLPNAS